MALSRIGTTVVLLGALTACDKLGLGGGSAAKPDAATSAAPSASAAAPAARGPVVTIPAGVLRAGTLCGDLPRITNEELVGEAITMGEFTIDVLPYPNDPTKPMQVNVTRDEAQNICAAAGKRLCTELEWERACKGPSNSVFEYGPTFNINHCKPDKEFMPDKRPKCVSAFGVKDMHGLAFEWTSSPWGRGSSGDLGVVRGGFGPAGGLQARCANGQSRPPSTKAADIGFRCCSGPVNPAQVNLTPTRQPPMVEEPSVETRFSGQLLQAMPVDHRTSSTATVSIDKVWRWHPRDNEEIVLARWTGKPNDAKPAFHELAAFKMCSGVPRLIARLKGPVATLGKPGAGSDPQKVSAPVQTKDNKGDVQLTYWYGSVQVVEPPWIKAGNSLNLDEKPKILKLPPRLRR